MKALSTANVRGISSTNFEIKAWTRLHEILIDGADAEPIAIFEQFRLRERIRRGHLRRERWNAKRRRKKVEAFMACIRPSDAAIIAAGFLGISNARTGEFRDDLVRGALCADARLTKKFLSELEVVSEMINPRVPPWEIDRERVEKDFSAKAPAYPERAEFVASLEAVPPPRPIPNLVPFVSEPDLIHEEDTKAPATAAATA